jgi:hypothetical protein
MKKLQLLLVFSFISLISLSQTIVFSDNFSDLSKWTLYGSPLPLNPATAKGRTGIFDNNGDSNYNSGAISKNTFLFAKNTKIVSEVYLDFSDLSGCWNSASIGIANTEYKSWGGYDPYLSFSLTANGDACWASPANTRRHAVFYAGYLSTTGQVNFGSDMLTVADNYMNKWVKLTIEIDDNGVPAFYADNALIFKGTQPLATAVTSAQLPLWLGDRSSGSAGKAYHDNISIYSNSQVTNSDLAVSNFSFSPQTITAGLNPEVVSFRLTNNGPANLSSPNTRVDGKFYISKNTTFGDSDDIQIGVNGYDFTVASGGYTDVTLSATGMSYLSVPTSTAAGSYNVFVQVVHMPPSGLTDPTPSNNYAMRTGTISVVSGETATLKIGTVNGSIGNNVSIPVTATSIKDIAGFQFTLEYDATKLSYVNCTNWPSNVSGITVSNPKAGKITFVYSDPNNLVNITSGKFFDVNFNVIAASGTPLILWSDDPTARLFVNSNLETLNCAYFNGSVSIITGFKLSGSLAYDNTNMTPLINEGITLLNSSGQSTGNNFTDGSGLFSFDGLSNDTYILKPVVTLPWGNSGVNVTDVLIYKQFIAKSRTLSSFRERAGDVNGSGLPVNVTDVLLIMRRLGDPSKTFTAGDWLFDNTSAVINNSGKSGQNILALCYGDANGSYTPTTNKSASNIFVEGNDKVKMLTNNEFEVPFRIDNTINNLAAVGLTFSYPYEIFEVREIKMTKGNEDLYYTAIDGTIRIVFATLNTFEQPSDQPLFTIRFKLKENADFYEIEKSTSIFAGFGDFADVTAKEFHGLNVIYGGINKDLIEQLIKNKEVKIYPNPAKNFVNITNVENSEISVSDIHGRMVMKVIGNSNLFRLDLDGLKTGVYLISVKKDQYIANEKITFIK